MKVIVCLALLVVVAAAKDAEWESFKAKFGKIIYNPTSQKTPGKRTFVLKINLEMSHTY